MRLGMVATAAMAVLGLVLGGCASNKSTATPVISSMKDLRADMVSAQAAVGNTQAVLKELSTTTDLAVTYEKLNKSVADLNKSAANLKKQADEMRAKGQEYIAKWKEEMDKVADEDIRASAAQRRDAVAANFDSIKETAGGARDSYQKYSTALTAIQATLKNDMTPAGVNMISKSVEKTLAEGETLDKELTKLIGHLDKVKAGMATTRPTTVPAK